MSRQSMHASVIEEAWFEDESQALAKLEQTEWPDTPTCPHCLHRGPAYDLSRTRAGLKKCRKCGMQFTVRAGTVLQGSHLPLHLWLQAIFLLTAGDKPVSALKVSRTLGISYKTSWLLTHRIKGALHVARG